MKFNYLLSLSAVALAFAAISPAHATALLSPAAQTKLDQQMLPSNKALVKNLAEAKDAAAKQALLTSALSNPNNAFGIMSTVTTDAPTQAKPVLTQILAILAAGKGNDEIIAKLSDLYGAVLASVEDNIEPAAGPGSNNGAGTANSGVGNNPGENPDQLNGDPATPPASPSNPS